MKGDKEEVEMVEKKRSRGRGEGATRKIRIKKKRWKRDI